MADNHLEESIWIPLFFSFTFDYYSRYDKIRGRQFSVLMRMHMKKIWRINDNEHVEKQLMEALNIEELTARILQRRGLSDPEKAHNYLYPEIDQLHDPLMMANMETAVTRIHSAIAKGEQIWIYGDYDVDGITSISLLTLFFEDLGVNVGFYIPNRNTEGYGISLVGLDHIKEQGGDLVISVDCGITAVEQAHHASTIGVDLIITDHHEPQDTIPSALAVINPKIASDYPFDMLAGVGVAFKLAMAIDEDVFIQNIDRYIDLCALGTIADIAPLNDENRVIAKHGLEQMLQTSNIGLKALIEVSALSDKKINAGHISFGLAPRINACGRMGHPEYGVELLTTKDPKEAKRLADVLFSMNQTRQEIEKAIFEEVDAYIDANIDISKTKVIVARGHDWHHGIIGIVASKITEKYYRPTLIVNIEDGIGKGSARSIDGINLFEVMQSCGELFDKFGGHAQAAGFSLPEGKIDALAEALNASVPFSMNDEVFTPKIKAEGLLTAKDVNYKLLDELALMEPFGMGNPKPNFVYRNMLVEDAKLIGKDKTHIKLMLSDQQRIFDAVGFQMAELLPVKKTSVDVMAQLERNEFRGVQSIQLMIKDIRNFDFDSLSVDRDLTNYYLDLVDYLTENAYEQCKSIDIMSKFQGSKLSTINQSKAKVVDVWIHTDAGLKKMIRECEDMGIPFAKTLELPSGVKANVVILPNIRSVDFDKLVKIYLYDIPLKVNDIETLTKFKQVDKIYSSESIFSGLHLLKGIKPTRDDLVVVYKTLSPKGVIDVATENCQNLSPSKWYLALKMMQEAELLKFERRDSKLHYEQLAKPKQKVNIFATTIYDKMMMIVDDFENSVKQMRIK